MTLGGKQSKQRSEVDLIELIFHMLLFTGFLQVLYSQIVNICI